MSRWSEVEDELRRTTYAGQLSTDGEVVETTTVAPAATREPEVTGRLVDDEAVEARGHQLALIEG